MSQSVAYSSFETNSSTLITGLLSFYRRWFASETIHDSNALKKLGLGHLADYL